MSNMQSRAVMIAGVGGASLGTEIQKCLQLAGNYRIFGCDISKTSYGLYDPKFEKTFHIESDNYIENVINSCKLAGADYLVPGGEQPMTILGEASERLAQEGIILLGNSQEVIQLFSDKKKTFELLSNAGISIPKTIAIENEDCLMDIGLPCIVKPSTGTGGSASVFFAVSVSEAMIYADFIRRNGSIPIAQEYINENEGEFTIGVLSLPNKKVVGSVALRRTLEAKLSVSYRGRGGLISSGYSQGYIGDYHNLCSQAEKIAEVIGSCGPINIQGRVRDGKLFPFEINPRFSASTYLRAMAGFNEVDMFLDYLITKDIPTRKKIKPGWYLRSLTETYVQM